MIFRKSKTDDILQNIGDQKNHFTFLAKTRLSSFL